MLAAETRLADAVAADVRATEAALPDLAALAATARRRTHLLWSRTSGNADALTVRVGCGPGATRVTLVQADGRGSPSPRPTSRSRSTSVREEGWPWWVRGNGRSACCRP